MRISNYVNERGSSTIAELMAHFDVSHATIHRDIASLEEQGAIRRVRGGVAAVPEAQPESAERAIYSRYQDRIDRNREEKIAIAKRALAEIKDGDILFLDSSTTVYYLALELQKSDFANLTVISNSLLIIQEFSLFPTRYFLVALGGNYDPQLNAFLGQVTMSDLEKIRVDKAFISALGITAEGIFSRHENHSYFLREVLARSGKSLLLLTEDKFNRSGLFDIAPLEAVDRIISEAPLPAYAKARKK